MGRLTKYTVCKTLEIDAGHRIVDHESKCKNLHGHHYKFEIHARASQLNELGMVIDFGLIKEKVGQWLDEKWDHGMILWADDPLMDVWVDEFVGHKIYALPNNPTAENMADYLLVIANSLLVPFDITVVKVVCWETPTCSATAEL